MFENLFARGAILKRYCTAPLFEERLRYLIHCAQAGVRRKTLRGIAAHQVNLVQPPPEGSLRVVAKCLKDASAHWDHLEQQRQGVQDGLKRSRGDRRRVAELNRQKTLLLEPMQEAEDRAERLEMFEREIREALPVLAGLAACPACGRSDTEFKARAHDCFAARCRSKGCGAQWELRPVPEIASRVSGTDRATESRIPVFQPGGADPDDWPVNTAPQWVDDFLGCDVLAIPEDWADGRVDRFLPLRTTPRSP